MSLDLAGGVPELHPERKGALNVSPKSNWVEKRGGLPPYMNSIATALVAKGMTRSRAIATAVNVCKKTCATGHWGGRPNAPVSPAIRAAACSAVARWSAMKTTSLAVRSGGDDGHVVTDLHRAEARRILDLTRPQKSKARRVLRRLVDLAGPSTMERKRAAAKGQALPGGRFPIRNGDDLDKAIKAVGRAGTDHDAVRRFIIRRARALGLSSRIPDNWSSSGSLK